MIRNKTDIILFANSRDVFMASDIDNLYQQSLISKKRKLALDSIPNRMLYHEIHTHPYNLFLELKRTTKKRKHRVNEVVICSSENWKLGLILYNILSNSFTGGPKKSKIIRTLLSLLNPPPKLEYSKKRKTSSPTIGLLPHTLFSSLPPKESSLSSSSYMFSVFFNNFDHLFIK
jgi:hypothetical protein